jgi:hypothetical protein
MAVNLNRRELHRLARLGAQARLEQLERERALILRAFPGLEAGMPGSFPAVPASARPARRRRRGMSAAQRKAVSARMRKYWASRRKEKAAK